MFLYSNIDFLHLMLMLMLFPQSIFNENLKIFLKSYLNFKSFIHFLINSFNRLSFHDNFFKMHTHGKVVRLLHILKHGRLVNFRVDPVLCLWGME